MKSQFKIAKMSYVGKDILIYCDSDKVVSFLVSTEAEKYNLKNKKIPDNLFLQEKSKCGSKKKEKSHSIHQWYSVDDLV